MSFPPQVAETKQIAGSEKAATTALRTLHLANEESHYSVLHCL